jgi:hypothetical protein
MNRSPRLELVAGDDWQLDAILLDASSNPLDLTAATLEWTLIDCSGWSVSIAHTVTVDAAPGACTVKVAASDSTAVKGGGYMAYWRVVSGGITQTPLAWPLGIHADPFTAQPEPVTQQLERRPAVTMAPPGDVFPALPIPSLRSSA